MQVGSRVFLVNHSKYYGTIVGFNNLGDVVVEWDDAPGQKDVVHPHDIDEIEDLYYMAVWYKPVREAKIKRVNDILGVK